MGGMIVYNIDHESFDLGIVSFGWPFNKNVPIHSCSNLLVLGSKYMHLSSSIDHYKPANMPRWKRSGLLTLRLFYCVIVLGTPGALWASRRLNNNPILGTRAFVEDMVVVVLKDPSIVHRIAWIIKGQSSLNILKREDLRRTIIDLPDCHKYKNINSRTNTRGYCERRTKYKPSHTF